MSHLVQEDLLVLCLVHTRLRRLIVVHFKHFWKKNWIVDQIILLVFPVATSKVVYEAIGQVASAPRIVLRKEKDLLDVIKYFPERTALLIVHTVFKDVNAISKIFPRTLKYLYMNDTKMSAQYRKALFQHLNPTLELLSCYQSPAKDLLPLTNLRWLSISIHGVREGLPEVITNNRHLQYFCVYFYYFRRENTRELLKNLENLRKGEERITFNEIATFKFNNIDPVRVVLRGGFCTSFAHLLNQILPLITGINIVNHYVKMAEGKLWKLDTKLKVFEIRPIVEYGVKCVEMICKLTSVKNSEEDSKQCPEMVIKLNRGLYRRDPPFLGTWDF